MNRLLSAAALFSLALPAAAPAQFDSPPPLSRVPDVEPLRQLPVSSSQRKDIQSALAAGDYKRAETILVEQINKNPESSGLLLFTARLFLRSKDPGNAAISFKKAEKLRPLDAADRYAMAVAFMGIGRSAWAKPELLRLLQDEPANATYQYWIARIDYDERQYESAIQRLRLVTAAMPRFVRGWDNLGLALEGAGQLDEAVETYRRAVDLNRSDNPPSPWPPLNSGILLTKMARLGEGEHLIREALRYHSQLAAAHLKLGVNLQRQGQKDEAIRELRTAAELAPQDPSPFYPLSQLYRDSGDDAAAAEALQRFRALKKTQGGS
jgi:tetratricopeptide (TPR) repeat protein